MNLTVCFDHIAESGCAAVEDTTEGQCHDLSEGGLNLVTTMALRVGERARRVSERRGNGYKVGNEIRRGGFPLQSCILLPIHP